MRIDKANGFHAGTKGKETMANTDWENYGDINFVEYGGMLIRQDPDYMDRSYNVIQVVTPDSYADIEEGRVWAWYFTVDLDDDWYDWDSIKRSTDISGDEDDKELVRALVDYYGQQEWQGEGFGEDLNYDITVDELREALENIDAGEFA